MKQNYYINVPFPRWTAQLVRYAEWQRIAPYVLSMSVRAFPPTFCLGKKCAIGCKAVLYLLNCSAVGVG